VMLLLLLLPGVACVTNSLSVGVIFASYALHVRYRPYLDPNVHQLEDSSAVHSGAKLLYVRVNACLGPGVC
jgi:hypothetical protein